MSSDRKCLRVDNELYHRLLGFRHESSELQRNLLSACIYDKDIYREVGDLRALIECIEMLGTHLLKLDSVARQRLKELEDEG